MMHESLSVVPDVAEIARQIAEGGGQSGAGESFISRVPWALVGVLGGYGLVKILTSFDGRSKDD